MADEPTLGEVMRQVRDLVQQVRDLVQEVRSDYVRKDLYDTRHHALTRRVDELDAELEDHKREVKEKEKAATAFQRQIIGGVIVGVLLMLANLFVTALMVSGGLR